MYFGEREINDVAVVLCDSDKGGRTIGKIVPLKESDVKRRKFEHRMKSVKCCIFEAASKRTEHRKTSAMK